MDRLTTEKHWNQVYRKTKFTIAGKNDPIVKFVLDRFIPIALKEESCFEIGCCPCGYLAYMAKYKNYKINGIDYSDELDSILEQIYKHDLNVGSIIKGDFFQHCKDSHKQYNVVMSFGFIEHFKNYEQVIKLHDRFVKPGGVLIITTPNYRGKINYALHRFFNYGNLKIHNIYSMNPGQWRDILEKHGYDVKFSGYFGGMNYAPLNEDEMPKVKKKIWEIIDPIIQFLNRNLKKDNSEWSAYCGIAAIKKEIKD